MTGAELILSGETDIAFNPCGGYHHARAEMASGFCYLNDLVLACMRFLNNDKRVLYLDIDAHHGDGVQEAFYASNQVMAISLHESGKTLWPGTGFENEIGDGPGKGFTVNVPSPIGICDAAYIVVFTEIVIPLIKAYDPDIFVLQTGMDALAADAIAHLELTNNAPAEIIDRLLRFNKPLLATGGGGYHKDIEIHAGGNRPLGSIYFLKENRFLLHCHRNIGLLPGKYKISGVSYADLRISM